ncbi:hypothetical protein ROZALSC1DRAFT_24878 [Rozella allomycis CSF55]|uniref:Uncharacterized protein n=1 Tax=Rozella allomycis (strain CSF55) TaxID=988480 RepID=A0A4P9YBT8_ROZAC|nr:hypothetical protein ROZALSC1DRAFT_24878 [Rozella allomycis CSF55]
MSLAAAQEPVQTGEKGDEIIVTWRKPVSFWLSPEATSKLRERISRKKPLVFEFVRELQPKFSSVQDTASSRFKGRFVVDGTQLLFPKVLNIQGKYNVESFENTISLDTEEESRRISIHSAGKSKNSVDAGKPSLYRGLGTTITLDLSLNKPLLEKKKLQPSPNQNSISARRRQRAIQLFEEKIIAVLCNLSTKYKDMLQYDIKDPNLTEEVQIIVTYPQGTQEATSLKEHLKIAVTSVVREHFNQKSAFAPPAEMKSFLNEVYVYMMDKLNGILGRAFQVENAYNTSVSKTAMSYDSGHLKQLAEESEQEKWTEMANLFHLERISRAENDVEFWFDYANFCMRSGMSEKAEECYRIILGYSDTHAPTLMAYGVYCTCAGKYSDGLLFLRSAIEICPKDPLPLTLLAYYYHFADKDYEAEHIMEMVKDITKTENKTNVLEFLISIQAEKFVELSIAQVYL